MDNNQRNSFRIGNDGIVLHGDKFSKIIYYENYNGNLNVRAVYKITDYDYNIHDDLVNIFDTIIQMERNEFDEELTKAILRDYQLQYKALFQRYNTKTGRYIRYPRGYYKNASGNSKSAVRTRVSNGNQQVEKVNIQSQSIDPVGQKSIDDTIKGNDLRFAVDDEITDDLFSFDGDLFEEDNTKYLDEYIKTSPQEAVLSMYNSLAKTGENKKAAGYPTAFYACVFIRFLRSSPRELQLYPFEFL